MKNITLLSDSLPCKISFILIVVILVSGIGITGCASRTTSIGLTPEELGEIGAQIQNNPDRSGEIFSRYEVTEAEFERAVREVTSAPGMARRYREAFERNLKQ